MHNRNSSDVWFWEKPGCVGNSRQKALLQSQGCSLQVRDLLTTCWSEKTLRSFFGNEPVHEWFNLSAPIVKSHELNIHALSAVEALELMVAQPILIRRPLLQFGQIRQAGFEAGAVLDELNIELPDDKDLQSCPMKESDDQTTCEVSA